MEAFNIKNLNRKIADALSKNVFLYKDLYYSPFLWYCLKFKSKMRIIAAHSFPNHQTIPWMPV
jgi:hypothetical protein